VAGRTPSFDAILDNRAAGGQIGTLAGPARPDHYRERAKGPIMKRLASLLCGVATVFVMLRSAVWAADAPPPNFVVIFIDDK
jgi:hypothetical protein